jgi:hypothetical protein
MSYADYLDLDRILAAQHPLSADPNELLFIIQHQVSELWMRLMLHEIDGAIAAIRDDHLPQSFKALARVSRIMEQLVNAWSVLATMTPSEYSVIRLQSRELLRLPVLPVPGDRVPARQQEPGATRAAPARSGAAPNRRGRAGRAIALRRGDPLPRAPWLPDQRGGARSRPHRAGP